MHKKNLDLSAPFRLTGLSPNAHLDIIPISEIKQSKNPKPKTISKCSIAVQYPDGQRYKIECQLNYPIWTILKKLELENNLNVTRQTQGEKYMQPQIQILNTVYKNLEEFKLTLRKIGIKKGENILIRISFVESENYKDIEQFIIELDNLTHLPPSSIEFQKSDYQSKVESSQIQNNDKTNHVDTSNSNNNTENEESQEMEIDEEEDNDICIQIDNIAAKKIKLFRIGSGVSDTLDDINEEDFELNSSDIHSLISTIQKNQMEREIFASKPKKIRKYSSSLVRIRFPQGFILQGTFSTTSTLQDIHEMITAVLKNPSIPFYLFTAPPVQKYQNLKSTLEELKFVPAIILNISSPEKLEIQDDIFKNIQDLSRQTIPQNENKEPEEPIIKSMNTSKKNEEKNNEKKIPKWFQMGFKKNH